MEADKLIVVSGDSHATPAPEVFPDYLESKYQGYLSDVYEDNERYTALLSLFSNFSSELLEFIDTEGAWATGGYLGCWDVDRRLVEMDREGIAAEFTFAGDPRAILPLAPLYRDYPQEVVAAGARAYHRWAADTFKKATDRILLTGDPSAEVDIASALAEMKWTAEHGFVAVNLPTADVRKLPALYAPYWEPFWSACEDLGMSVICHAGYGSAPGEFFPRIEALRIKMEAEGRSDLLSEIINNAEGFFSLDMRPRRAMWQMMLGGVFDRHPRLRLMMTEVRGDWLPATMDHLDAAYERTRRDLPAEHSPSDYWRSNCIVSLSFVHKSEVQMRHEIDIETITFGRDYPHAEGTWPNTADWLSDAFADVPESELRLMLGENAIRVLGLDRARLAAVADRIGPSVECVTGRTPVLDPRLLENWDARGGYLKPPEQIDGQAIDLLLNEDIELARITW